MRGLALALLLVAIPLDAQTVWSLRSGPTATQAIPLDPVQPVSSWRAQYTDGTQVIWVYATRSPQFFLPRKPEVVVAAPTPWTVAFFFPEAWVTADRVAWRDRWLREFVALATLPDPGFPIVFPAVLR